MAEDLDQVAGLLLARLFGDTSITEGAAPFLSGVLGDAFRLGGKLTGQGEGWLDKAFDLVGATGTGRAYRLAEALVSAVPPDAARQMTQILSGQARTPSTVQTPGLMTAERTPKDVIGDLVKRLRGSTETGAREAAAALETLGRMYDDMFELAIVSPSGPGGPSGPRGPAGGAGLPGGKWNPETVVRMVRRLILRWLKELNNQNLPGPNTKRVAAEIEAELLGPFEVRLVVGLVLTTGGIAIYGVDDLTELLRGQSPAAVPGGVPGSPVTPRNAAAQMGTEVHEVLQEEYRSSPARALNVIVQESTVYTRGTGQRLEQVALQDANLAALYLARDVYLLRIRQALSKNPSGLAEEVRNALRDDNLDLTMGAIWEIKPIRGAALGVVQEFTYRSFFNFYAALVQDVPSLRQILRPGKVSWATRDHVLPGTTALWGEVVAKPARHIRGRVGRYPTMSVLLVTVDPLPGIVLYIRLDMPVALVYLLAAFFNHVLNEIAKRAKQAAEIAMTAIAFAVIVVVALVVAAAIIFAIVEAAEVIVAVLAELVMTLGPILAGLGVLWPRIQEIVQELIEAIAPLRQAFGLSVVGVNDSADGRICLRFSVKDGTPDDAVPRASATFGWLRLENAPVQLLVALPGVLSIANVIASALVRKRLDDAGTVGA